MTEQDWLVCVDPRERLRFLRRQAPQKGWLGGTHFGCNELSHCLTVTSGIHCIVARHHPGNARAPGKEKLTLRGKDTVWGVSFSPDGRQLVPADRIRLFDFTCSLLGLSRVTQ